MTDGDTMATLDHITIRGFKSIRALEHLKLNRINVLIGPNGSGKSNFIEAFSFVRDVVNGQLRHFVVRADGANRILHFGATVTERIDVGIMFDDAEWYELTIEHTAGDSLGLVHQSASKWQPPLLRSEHGYEQASVGTLIDPDPWVHYHFHNTGRTSPMKRLGHLQDNRRFRADGGNLAAFLYYLRRGHPESYSLIRQTVQQVAPFFDDFVLEPQELNRRMIHLEWRHQGSDSYFDAASLSDGTLRFVALTTLLLQPENIRPSVILLDEPELGLHPYAITLLASLVKQAAVDSQIIMATQSPTLLDHFEPEDVIVANRVRGEAMFERLDAEKLAVWLEDYSIGELWEKNEIGGRPAEEWRRS